MRRRLWLILKIYGFRQDLLAYARSLTRESSDAEDLLQEMIARAMKSENLPEDDKALKAWAIRTMLNLHIDQIRKNTVRREYAPDLKRLNEEKGEAISPIEKLVVREAFEKLSEEHREILYLVDIFEMRYSEAAEVLNIAQGTVMSRVSRARRALLEELQDGKVTAFPGRKRAQKNAR